MPSALARRSHCRPHSFFTPCFRYCFHADDVSSAAYSALNCECRENRPANSLWQESECGWRVLSWVASLWLVTFPLGFFGWGGALEDSSSAGASRRVLPAGAVLDQPSASAVRITSMSRAPSPPSTEKRPRMGF